MVKPIRDSDDDNGVVVPVNILHDEYTLLLAHWSTLRSDCGIAPLVIRQLVHDARAYRDRLLAATIQIEELQRVNRVESEVSTISPSRTEGRFGDSNEGRYDGGDV